MHITKQEDSLYCYICATTTSKHFIEICKCNISTKYIHYDCLQDYITEIFSEKIKIDFDLKVIDEILNDLVETIKCNRCKENINIKNDSEFTFSKLIRILFCLIAFILGFGYEIYRISWVPFRSFILLIKIKERIEFLLLYIFDSIIKIFYFQEYKTDVIINYIYYIAIGTNDSCFFFLFYLLKYFSKYHRQQANFSTELNRRDSDIKHNLFGLNYKLFPLYIERGYIFNIFPLYISLYLLYTFPKLFNIFNIWCIYLLIMLIDGIIHYLLFRNKYYGYQLSYKLKPDMSNNLEFN